MPFRVYSLRLGTHLSLPDLVCLITSKAASFSSAILSMDMAMMTVSIMIILLVERNEGKGKTHSNYHAIGDDIGIHVSVPYKQPISYSADAVISIKYRQGTGICQKLPE